MAGIPLEEFVSRAAVLDGFLAGFHVGFIDAVACF